MMPGRTLFLLLAILNASCMLQDAETNFVHVDQTGDPQYIANLTYSYSGTGNYYPVRDTLWLAAGENLNFNLSDSYIFRVMAELDGKPILDEDHNASIWVDSKGLTNGPHQLKITQFVTSGTGSLANKLGVEAASYTATLVLIIGDVFNFTPTIQNLAVTDKGIAIQWNLYDRSDFQAYEIRKYSATTTSFESYIPHRKFIVKDPTLTSFTDTTYVGGPATYIVTVDKGGKYFVSKDKKITFQFKLNMRLTPSGTGRARLSWDLPPFHKNIRDMSVSIISGLSETKLAQNIPPEQTSVEIDYSNRFGQTSQFSLALQGDAGGEPLFVDRFAVFENLMPGVRTLPISMIRYNQKEDAYYMLYNNGQVSDHSPGIYRLDKNLRIADSLTSTFGTILISPDGNRIFLARPTSLVELETSPLQVKQSFNFNLSTAQTFAVTNNNYLHYQTTDKVNILDFATGTVLFSNARGSASHISPDGQYLVNGTTLYKFDGTQFQTVGVLPFADIRYVHFMPSGDKLFIATVNKAIVYDHINSATIKEFNFSMETSNRPPEFNDLTMTFVTRGAGLKILNIDTGEERSVPVTFPDGAAIEGEYLFSNLGFGLKPY